MVFDQIFTEIQSAEKIDPHAARDASEPLRRQTFVTLVVAHLILGILGVLTFMQFLGEHRGQSKPVNVGGARGGWDSGNDLARVVVTVFGTLVLMVADVLVNDPANFPERFTKSYRESLTAIGFSIGMVSLGCLFTSYLDIIAVSAYTGCASCDRAEYIATCLFDIFAAIALLAASISMVGFARATPERLAEIDVATQELLEESVKTQRIAGLPEGVVAVVAVHAPCCGVLVAIDELEQHRAECEQKRLELLQRERDAKEERRRQRQLARLQQAAAAGGSSSSNKFEAEFDAVSPRGEHAENPEHAEIELKVVA